ncbi:hypothetical protein RND81_06G217600 [Saponaria officinalis]|uniref:DUF4283 domain-containing protein n=1 Tax=Saponaria officinalis TaxID=3572 RepID=A0AAW1K978_SAPOF
MTAVLKEGPWKLGANSIIFKQWTPTFSAEMDRISVVPVWVLFPGLDPYMWFDTVLSKLASKIGKPLFADKNTTNKARLSFARVMVEVDVSAPLIDHILVHNPFTGHDYQKVTYEFRKRLAPHPTELHPNEGDMGSGSQILGGTSGPNGQPLIALEEEVNQEGGLPSSSSVLETPILEAVKHLECSELGPRSSQLDGLFTCLVCNPLKLKEVLDFLTRGNIDVLALLETRIRQDKAAKVTHHVSCAQVHATFVYASNDGLVRRDLWDALGRLSLMARDWIVLGDFNVVRHMEERVSSHLPLLSDIMDFNQCGLSCCLDDIQGTGISDHSPVMVTLLDTKRFRKRFSFLNCWTKDPSYLNQSRQKRVELARKSLEVCQLQLQISPLNATLLEEERTLSDQYTKLRGAELNILKQKAKFDATLYNDSGTTFFHARINERTQAQMIGEISDHHGQIRQGIDDVASGFIEYYQELLGKFLPVADLDLVSIAGANVQQQDWEQLLAPVLNSEIKRALDNIDPLKSPGPDGFSSGFFTSSWSIIEGDFCKCVQEYFRTDCM